MTPAVITTVTLNPAVDEAVALDEFTLGAVNRGRLDALDPGGKGLNASRVIHRLGRDTLALGFLGGVTGAMIRAWLDLEGVPHAFDEVAELTRVNMMMYEHRTGRRTRLYLPGASVTAERLAALRTRLEQVPRGGVVVLGGSVPPGLPSTIYRHAVSWLHSRDVRCVIDASGAALANVLQASPELVKPNVEEAAEILGRPLEGDMDALAAARELHRRGAKNVVISQGAAGAIGVNAAGAWKAVPPMVETRSTVGSGDSMVAGLAIALNEGGTLCDGLVLGTAAGAATASEAGTHLCEAAGVEGILPRVIVSPLEIAA